MKKLNSKYFTIAVYALIASAAVLLFALLVFNFNAFFSLLGEGLRAASSILYGILFSLLLLPITKRFEGWWDKAVSRKKPHPRLTSVLGITSTYLGAVIVLAIVFGALIPALINNISSFSEVFNASVERVLGWIETHIATGGPLMDTLRGLIDYLNTSIFTIQNSAALAAKVVAFAAGFVSEIANIFLGLILSVYILASRRMLAGIISKIIVALLPEKVAKSLVIFAKRLYTDFCTYGTARLAVSLLFSVGAFLIMWLLGVPMFSVIVVLLLVSHIFPVIGPILGTTLSSLIVIVLAPARAWIVILVFIALEVFFTKLLLPVMTPHKLRPSYALVAALVIIGGGIFGGVGAFLALPLYTTFSVEVREWLVRRLNKKKLPVSVEAYTDFDISSLHSHVSNEEPEDKEDGGDAERKDEEGHDEPSSAADDPK